MRNFIIFPFLLAFFPAWTIILTNFEQLIFQDIIITLLVVSISILIWIGIKKIVRNENKASLITGIGIGFFFYFGYLQDSLKGIIIFDVPINRTSILLIISLIIFVLSTIYLIKSKRSFESTVKIANVITITLILVVVIPIFIPTSFAEKPNVYHIILDEYTDNEILEKKFNYDNSAFIEFLNKNEFHIPEKMFSSYASTPMELDMILNMNYPITEGWASENYQSMNNNNVMSVFSEQGYLIIETNSMMRYKNFSDVDSRLCYDTKFINSEFLDQLLSKSIIRYFLEKHQEDTRRDTIKCTFDELNEISSKAKQPFYIFSHMYVPHPPFLFGPNGEHISPDRRDISGLQSWENPDGYINQLIFATKEISIVVENIIENDPNAIIILQGDTGTLTGTNQLSKSFDDVYREHSILFAIKISDSNDLEHISPINTYRIIFNSIFNIEYEYLEEQNFTYDSEGNIQNITEKLHEYKLLD
tara:strand:- start:7309 stop:8733 length:1425 start_codon:yes stop_codon:yes gene_type:complete